MDDRLNTPHTDKIELDFLGYRLQLAQDPNSRHLGTTVWDSSMVFVKFLEQNCRKGEFSHSRLSGKRVIEVGAGCGLSGLGMALLGCHLVSTDQVEVLPLLIRNLERNMARAKHSPSESPYLGAHGTIEVAELNWGDKAQIQALNPPFDFIIGSDVVYKEQLIEPLLETLLALSGPKTTILLTNEFRSSSVHEKMLKLWKENFHMKIIPKSKMDTKYQHDYIQLYHMKPKVPVSVLHEDSEKVENGHESHPCIEDTEKTESTTNGSLNTEKTNLDALGNEVLEKQDKDVNREPPSTLSDWEIRRLGSMAARLLKDAL